MCEGQSSVSNLVKELLRSRHYLIFYEYFLCNCQDILCSLRLLSVCAMVVRARLAADCVSLQVSLSIKKNMCVIVNVL